VIEKKYLDMFRQLERGPATAEPEPLPGWFARRRRELPPANDVLSRLPSGAVMPDREARRDRTA
jgi:hypothetical protein